MRWLCKRLYANSNNIELTHIALERKNQWISAK
ncbi:hypothetical protein BN1049_00592 [Pseudomonas saudimassiliensis]|uniref:Uncharacterized protein n=1 Tax=Pseudomonas saudimassiliensis TaxID=1461581 RepID=A0A078M953_9PSED|nr:hypothetical protein BN1049_00592 [Pseudomonas saudimassiliensis]CEF25681.1 hypothetical protein BN1049_00592 [Pseudomonas saudimassiliensis]